MRIRKMVISTAAVGAIVLGSAAAAFAASRTDTGDHFSLKAGTKLSAKAGASSTVKCPAGSASAPLVFCGSVDGIPIWVKCTTFSASGLIPSSGLTVTLSAAPTFGGCSDSTKHSDTIKTNTTNGKWSLTEIDNPKETATEPNSGDQAELNIPKAGATFVSSFLPACVVVVAPTATAHLKGSFNDVTTIKDTAAALATAPQNSAVCTAGNTTVTGTITLSTAVHDTP
jgi:hypothetical protein